MVDDQPNGEFRTSTVQFRFRTGDNRLVAFESGTVLFPYRIARSMLRYLRGFGVDGQHCGLRV